MRPAFVRLARAVSVSPLAIGLVVALGAAALDAGPAAAQIPDTFTNLKVLPKDISRDRLIGTMRGFTRALGVRCDYCHARKAGERELDFPSDSLQHKRTARFMLRMVAMLNDSVLPRLPARGDPPVHVQCVTCHHGQQRPRQLEDVLAETVRHAGVDSAIAQYNALRERTYGLGVYDFGPGTLTRLAEDIAADSSDAALAVLRLNLQHYPDDAGTYEITGDILAARGELARARDAYQAALRLQPQNGRLRAKLERLPPDTAARAPHTMVVSAFPLASRVGDRVLREGGNAVDAAIAVGFALAVTHPSAGNIGGGGFMVIRLPDGRATTIDFRERAPLAASPDMFLDSTGEYSYQRHHESYLSIGVPGTVAGFALAHEKYGKLGWKRLVHPAVELADTGFRLTPALARSFGYAARAMRDHPASLAVFTHDGTPYGAGELWRQPELARTLSRIEARGKDGFYAGETARLIAEEMRRGGGLITEKDLAQYRAKERAPIRGSYRGYDVIGMPPPSSAGVTLVEMLNILEGFDLRRMGFGSADYIHHVAEAMRRAYRDRAEYLADTDFSDPPIARLTSKAYAAKLRATIRPDRATPSRPADIAQAYESPQTTHYSVVDASGMAVAVTYTLEQGYGSKVVVPGAGFLLNNEMGDFNGAPGVTDTTGLIGTEPNRARPGQRMLSSMSPTILARDGKLVAVLGSPGGRTIINTVLGLVLGIVDFDMGIQQAVDAKRLHHQWLPDVLRIEEGGADEATVRRLEEMGYTVRVGGQQGVADCVMIDPATGDRLGAADPRDEDSAAVGH